MIFGTRLCLLASLMLAMGCGSTGPYVWVDSLPAARAGSTEGVIIQDGDVVRVRVFNQEPLSTKEKVRSDGKISMPVIGEVMARNKKPAQLASEIQDRLKSVVVAPSVTVTLSNPDAEHGDLKVYVVGEVKNGGPFPL